MDVYSGSDLRVGEIRAVRTFRVGPGGLLYPLFSDAPWSSGTNTASCRFAPTENGMGRCSVPEPDCTCGFYAYACEAAATEFPNARYILAVVACWGHVIAGTRGIRAQHARIEAIWMSDIVPSDLAAQVRDRYPTASIHHDKSAMLAEHPPTVLDCYQTEPTPERTANRRLLRCVVLAAFVLGALPRHWLGSSLDTSIAWGATVGLFVVGALVLGRRRPGIAWERHALLFGAVALWLIAPYANLAGSLLLRIPLIQIAALALYRWRLLEREAARFPARINSG